MSHLEQERRFAGLESGLIIGAAVGLLAGIGFGMLSVEVIANMRRLDPTTPVPVMMAQPWMPAVVGALLGLIAGGLIGWVIDQTLNRLGAGPPLPAQETLVTVRTDDTHVDRVYDALFNARARHLHHSVGAPGA